MGRAGSFDSHCCAQVETVMRILVDVDRERNYRSSLSLLSRLSFASPELVLTHVEQRILVPQEVPYLSAFATESIPTDISHQGMGLLLEASAEASLCGLSGETMLAEGHHRDQIESEIRKLDTDLFCTAWAGDSHGGSVREDECSMLAAVPRMGTGPVKCLFATDHSPYAAQAFERFLSWSPAGIDELIVFTALELSDRLESAINHRTGTPDDSHDARRAAHQGECLANYIHELGIKASSRIITGHIPHAIDRVVKEAGVELVILGAQGAHTQGNKGFGTVTTAVLEHADYSVLVLQA